MASRSQSLRRVLTSASIAWLGLFANGANAQQTSGSGASSRDLPPVVVNPPNPRAASAPSKPSQRAASSGASRQAQRAARTAAVPSKPPVRNIRNVQPGQDPRGPINGYVAERSLTGTKTNTPLMETPQAISVIGREQIRDQNPNSFAEALRYAPGVRSETFGADTRNDWFKIRGFDTQDAGCFSTDCSFPVLRLPHGNSSRSASSESTALSGSLWRQRTRGTCECDQQEAAV
jgi:iron complex outermembrane recepter protein